jgi:hypothetical protein
MIVDEAVIPSKTNFIFCFGFTLDEYFCSKNKKDINGARDRANDT